MYLSTTVSPELFHGQQPTGHFQGLFGDFVGEEVGGIHHRDEQNHGGDGHVRVLEADLMSERDKMGEEEWMRVCE